MSESEKIQLNNEKGTDSTLGSSDEYSDDISGEEASVQAEKADTETSGSEIRKPRKKPAGHNRIPLLIAGCIFLAAILFFGSWKCFFDTALEGTWSVEMSSSDGSQHLEYTFSFDEDNVFRMHNGGTTYIGRYFFDRYDDGTEEGMPIVSIYITNMGRQFISGDFGYQFEGNAFTGRLLKLTDLSGIFFPPDSKDADEETVRLKKSVTDSVKIDDTTYYIWDFSPAEVKDHIDYFDDFKVHEDIIGSWLCEDKEEGFSYTLTFDEDGTFEQRSYEISLHGSYHFDGKKCTLSFYDITDTHGEITDEPVINKNKLSFNGSEYVKASGRDDYKREAN